MQAMKLPVQQPRPAQFSGLWLDPTPTEPARILCIGRYPTLLTARTMALRRAGYPTEAMLLLEGRAPEIHRAFEIFVLCRSINGADALKYSKSIKAQYPTSHVLRLVMDASESSTEFDSTSESLREPGVLFRHLAKVLAN